jgi:uncharacterized membrane protein YgaE (UPF0421/DUF939 family)
MKPERPAILKRGDYISSIRSDIAELEFNLRNAADELEMVETRIEFGKEQRLRRFVSMLKTEKRIINWRIKTIQKSIKKLHKLLLIAENTLG